MSEKDRNIDKMRTKLIKEFPDVFADTLIDAKMRVLKKKIEFVDNPQMLKKAYTAKEPPIHWRPQAKYLLQDLVKQGIIAEVKHTTDFCARANFMPKPGGEDLRLVTDFRGINHIILRPVYPFQTTESILNNITAEDHYLATMDMLSGYFQIGAG